MPGGQDQTANTASLADAVSRALEERYEGSQAGRYGIDLEAFHEMARAVLERYAGRENTSDQLALLQTLHVEELVLARACAAGNEAAWEDFLGRYRARLYAAAYRIARDEAAGRELADGLYAELWGLGAREARRVSKLDYYTGRGSLEGWLRAVLAQRHIDRVRACAKDVSMEEQVERGASFAAKEAPEVPEADERVARAVAGALADAANEERFLLAAYFLDRRTLAEIGRQMAVHESTVSRKLERATAALRKQVRKRLLAAGLTPARCGEVLEEIDVRGLRVDVEASLRQERRAETF